MSAADTVADLEAEQETRVEEVLRLREAAGEDRSAQRELQKAMGKLDALYWKRVSALVGERMDMEGNTLALTDEERLLVDMGLLDMRLVEGGGDELRERMLAELQVPGAANHFYLTEWLEDRFRRERLAREMAAEKQEAAEEDTELGRLLKNRQRIYETLRPYFSGLPGVSEEILEHIVNGTLDDQIQTMGIALLDGGSRPAYLRRHGLRNLRTQVLSKLRARLPGEQDLKRLDALERIYARTWRERYSLYESGEAFGEESAEEESDPARSELARYLEGELKFVKSLMPLGALAGGRARACAVLAEDRPRITKDDARRELRRVQEYDRDFGVNPVVLIAPFSGRGIFEWDRDSLLVPLMPVDSEADAVANAAANYRMAIDTLQQEGALKAAYEGAFPDSRFQQAFLTDYRTWICGVCRGEAEAMSPDHLAFFRERIAPPEGEIPAPAGLRNLGPEARAGLVKRLQKQLSLGAEDAGIHHRLAVLLDREGEGEEALEHLTRAAALRADDGMILYSLGVALQRSGRMEMARLSYTRCRERAPATYWAVAADRAVEKENG
jgi:tetratricopeptide (TPR) repeat protein